MTRTTQRDLCRLRRGKQLLASFVGAPMVSGAQGEKFSSFVKFLTKNYPLLSGVGPNRLYSFKHLFLIGNKLLYGRAFAL